MRKVPTSGRDVFIRLKTNASLWLVFLVIHDNFSQAPSPESNPNSPSPVVTMVSHYLTIDS